MAHAISVNSSAIETPRWVILHISHALHYSPKRYRVQPWYTRRCRVTVRQYYLHNATCENSVPYHYMNFSEYMHAILGAYQMDAELYFKRHALGWAATLISRFPNRGWNCICCTFYCNIRLDGLQQSISAVWSVISNVAYIFVYLPLSKSRSL